MNWNDTEQVKECISTLVKETKIEEELILSAIRWISLINCFARDNSDERMFFVADRLNVAQDEVFELFTVLEKMSYLYIASDGYLYFSYKDKELGITKDYANSIDSLISDAFLTELITDVVESRLGIPNRDHCLKMICYRANSLNKLASIQPILTIIEDKSKNSDNVIIQTKLISLIESIGPFFFYEALDYFKNVSLNITDDKVYNDEIWGDFLITHKSVCDKIPWKIFTFSMYANDDDKRWKLYELFKHLITIETQDASSKNSESAISLLKRILFSERWSNNFNHLVDSEINSFFEKIEAKEELIDKDRILFTLLIENRLNFEKNYFVKTNETTITMNKRFIVPENGTEWDELEPILNKCKNHIELSSSFESDVTGIILDSYINSFKSIHRSVLPEKDPEKQNKLVDDYMLSELNWIRKILERGTLSIQIKKKLREIWSWFRDTSIKDDFKEVAQNCENAYSDIRDSAMFINLCNFSERENKESAEQFFIEKLKRLNSAESLFQFLNELDIFAQNNNAIYDANLILVKATPYIDDGEVLQFIRQTVLSDNEYYYSAGMIVLRIFLGKFRKQGNVSYVLEVVREYHNKALDKDRFLADLYRYVWVDELGVFEKKECDYILPYLKGFKEWRLQFNLIGNLSLPYWDEMTVLCEDILPTLSDEQKVSLIDNRARQFFSNDKMTELYDCYLTSKKVNWFTSVIFSMEKWDELERISYILESFIYKEYKIPTELLIEEVIHRIEDNRAGIGMISSFFSFSKISENALSTDKFKEMLFKLTSYLTSGNPFVYDLPKFLIQLDPDGNFIASIISQLILENEDFNQVVWYARVAGELKDDTEGWDIIAKAVGKKALTISDKQDKAKLFSTLNWKGVETYGGSVNEVPSYFYEKVDTAKERLESADPLIKPYWEIELDKAQQNLGVQQKRLKERGM